MVINPILFPVSTSCNLRCLYCFHREGHTPISEDFLMSDAVLSRVISELLKVGPNRVRFIWHGGEPLLAGLEFYEKVVYFQEKYRGENQQIKNAIQTNGTLLTPEYIQFCKEHDFGVGVSIDGPEWLQNYQRPSASGKGTFQKVMDGINLLTDSRAKFGGILAVVTRNSLPHSKELYEFMRGNFQSFDFLPCFEIAQRTKKPISLSVDHIGFANFMIDIFDMWFEDDDPSIKIRTLNRTSAQSA